MTAIAGGDPLHGGDRQPALLTNLLATLPLALVRKRLALGRGAIVLAVSVALGEQSR